MSHTPYRLPVFQRGSNTTSGLFTGTTDTIDAATERIAMIGKCQARHWLTGTKEISAVKLCFVTKANGTGTTNVRCSLRDVDLVAAGPVAKDDGVVDQSSVVNITSLTGNGALNTFTLDTTRTVSRGDLIAVVIDFTDFGTGPSLNVATYSTPFTGGTLPCNSSYIGTPAWQARGGVPSVGLVCTDGTTIYIGPQEGVVGITAGTNYNSGSTGTALDGGDERGMLWNPRKPWVLRGGAVFLRCQAAGAAGEMVLYRDDTVLWSETIISSLFPIYGNSINYEFTFPTPIYVYPKQNIRLTCRPTNTTDGWRLAWTKWASVNDMVEYYGGLEDESIISHTQRLDQTPGGWIQPSPSESTSILFQLYGYPAEPWGVPLYQNLLSQP